MAKVAFRPTVGIHDPETVGTNQAHVAATQLLLNLPLEFDAFRASLAESRRDNDRRLHARVDTFADNVRDRGRGRGYHRQVNLFRKRANARVCRESTDFGVSRIDRVHLPLKGGMPEIFENSAAHRTGTLSGANNGHRTGRNIASRPVRRARVASSFTLDTVCPNPVLAIPTNFSSGHSWTAESLVSK